MSHYLQAVRRNDPVSRHLQKTHLAIIIQHYRHPSLGSNPSRVWISSQMYRQSIKHASLHSHISNESASNAEPRDPFLERHLRGSQWQKGSLGTYRDHGFPYPALSLYLVAAGDLIALVHPFAA